jgi:beta-lactam-binding protein with PASTA domain
VNRYLMGALVALLAALVVIEVTAEPGKVDVPPLVGLDLGDAKNELQAAGLDWGVHHILRRGEDPFDFNVPAPTTPVVGQSPAAGTEVDRGTQVELRTPPR